MEQRARRTFLRPVPPSARGALVSLNTTARLLPALLWATQTPMPVPQRFLTLARGGTHYKG